MRVLLLNANELEGGAAIATNRLFRGLRAEGVDARLMVQKKQSDDPFVIGPPSDFKKAWYLVRPAMDSRLVKKYSNRQNILFSVNGLGDDVQKRLSSERYDLLHLNWMNNGFLKIENVPKLPGPVVWTFHDMWGFTGGCHVTGGCMRWKMKCGRCPILSSDAESDLSAKVFRRKMSAWKGRRLTIVTPGNWLAGCVRESPIFAGADVRVIPNGLDVNVFKPVLQAEARQILGLPQDRKLILFGAIMGAKDPNKGFDLLAEALKDLKASGEGKDAELIVTGQHEPLNAPDLSFAVRYAGHLHDEVTRALYCSAADVVVVPSRQENFPNTACEALACGVPVVAFAIGGIPEIVDHGSTGALAAPYETHELAEGIAWVLGLEGRDKAKVSEAARMTAVSRFDIAEVAKQYRALYEELGGRAGV